MVEKNTAIIALGANLPHLDSSPLSSLKKALACLCEYGLDVIALSRFYQTASFPPGSGPDFINAAAMLSIPEQMSPHALLDVLHNVEARFARARKARWGARTLDLDLIAFGDTILPDIAGYNTWKNLAPDAQKNTSPQDLILPHPRLQDRAFVLVPLLEIAPNWVHPVLHKNVATLCAERPKAERADVERGVLSEPEGAVESATMRCKD